MCAITKIDVYTQYKLLKKYAESVLNLWSQAFQDDIYLVAFFLNPLFQKTSISCWYNLWKINWMICNLASWWGFSAAEGYTIKDQVMQCYNNQFLFQSDSQQNDSTLFHLSSVFHLICPQLYNAIPYIQKNRILCTGMVFQYQLSRVP